MSSNTQKLRVIRSRTDHDLLILVQHELDRGFMLADLASTRNSPLYADAVKAHDRAAGMILRISAWENGDRAHIEARLKDLRSRLDEVPAYANLRSYPASFAS